MTGPLTPEQKREESVQAELLDLVRAGEEMRLNELGLEAVAWLALAPGWSHRLAEACDFPGDGVEELVERAETMGYCAVARPPDAEMSELQRLGLLSSVAEYLTPAQADDGLRIAIGAGGPQLGSALIDLAPALGPLALEPAMAAAADLRSRLPARGPARAPSGRARERARRVPSSGRGSGSGPVRRRCPQAGREVVAGILAGSGRSAHGDARDRRRACARLALVALHVLLRGDDRVLCEAAIQELYEQRPDLDALLAPVIPASAAQAAVTRLRNAAAKGARPAPLLRLVEALSARGHVAEAALAAAAVDDDGIRALALGIVAAACLEQGLFDEAESHLGSVTLSLDMTVDRGSKVTVTTEIARRLAAYPVYAVPAARAGAAAVGEDREGVVPLRSLTALSKVLREIGDVETALTIARRALKAANELKVPRRGARPLQRSSPLGSARSIRILRAPCCGRGRR